MTKEAKLQAAMRILPEWIGYDEEIKALQLKIENENRQAEKEGTAHKSILRNLLIIINYFKTKTILLNFRTRYGRFY